MTLDDSSRVVIVGAGHGGVNLAALLRQSGYDGEVTLVGDEPCLPYQRPPLSKDYLKGAMSENDLLIKPAEFFAEQQIDARTGTTARSIDADSRRVVLDDETSLDFSRLVIATGAAPRRLSIEGADLDGIHYLRTHQDALALARAARPGARIAIVGGGYVGLEVAASVRHLGGTAAVIERETRTLARVAGTDLAAFLSAYHASRGVEVVTGADVARFAGDGHVAGVVLADGRTFDCDAVLVGVGAVPRVELAASAGALCDSGVVVDDRGRTSVAGIYAIGDVTCRPLEHFPGHHRLESIPSAVEQAKRVVADIVGAEQRPLEVPWFWSDQYDLKIKIAGLVGTADTSVVRGDPATGKFAVFHLREGVVVAAETVNSSPEFMLAKKLIAAAASADPRRLGDPNVAVRDLAA